jgi:two-component system, NarL family, response regulator YdfI
MIRVLIKVPSPIVRAGLSALLRPYRTLRIVEDSWDSDGASENGADTAPPDVVVAQLQDQHDANVSLLLEDVDRGVPIVLLAPDPAAEWLRQGIQAVLPNDAPADQIAAAIEAVAAGLVAFPIVEMESLLKLYRPQESPESLPETLTRRETEVLRFMSEGLGNKEIASRLGISEHTVKFHAASIMGKLGASSRTEAVTMGFRHGIVLI